MLIKSLLSVLVFLSICIQTQAQTPFDCDGNAYLIISPQNRTQVYRVNTNLASGAVTYDLISETTGLELNAVGYRKTDNFIYGINGFDNGLYRIDATGNIEFVAQPAFSTDNFYAAGDVSPDGRYLVVIGSVNDQQVLRYINLENGQYSVTDVELNTTNGESIFCTDLAFDPLTGLAYGFDVTSNRLVSIDPQTGIVDNTSYPENDVVGNLPSLFFDSFGQLFGLGSGTIGSSSVNLYQMDINTGRGRLFAPASDLGGNSDGCSCPYSLAVNQSFVPSIAFPCTQTQLTLRIANLTTSGLANAELTEVLPPSFSVQEFVENPFGGTVISPLGTNLIEITDMTIPVGVDSIVMLIDIGESPIGTYRQQARLEITDIAQGLDTTLVSDNPLTPIPNDSSTFEVIPLFVDLSNNQTQICAGDELVLESTAGTGLTYKWNNGSTAPQLLVDTPGLYSVTVDTGCEIASDTIRISLAELEVELGEDMRISLGDEVRLAPNIYASGEVSAYFWYRGVNTLEAIDCADCPTYSEAPISNTSYTLVIRDEFGCEAEDNKDVQVLKDYALFAPNAFSPNQDGQNDWFYLQTKQPLLITEFRVFDRWGSLIFEVKNKATNIPLDGWNGTVGGKLISEGVYVWTANVKWPDGVVELYNGEILLLY